MALLLARYRVSDRNVFREVFDEFQTVRAERGATSHRLLHGVDDPNVVVALIEFPDAATATAFAADPRREAALGRATVTARDDLVLDDGAPVRYG